jgi:hypothetical protein
MVEMKLGVKVSSAKRSSKQLFPTPGPHVSATDSPMYVNLCMLKQQTTVADQQQLDQIIIGVTPGSGHSFCDSNEGSKKSQANFNFVMCGYTSQKCARIALLMFSTKNLRTHSATCPGTHTSFFLKQ